jgi:hypothetical protein
MWYLPFLPLISIHPHYDLTSTMETSRTTFLRMEARSRALDVLDVRGDASGAASTSTSSNMSGGNLDRTVLWGVTAFLCFMLILVCSFCYYYRGNNISCFWLTQIHERPRQAGEEYEEQQLRQQQDQQARKIDTPADRKHKILQSFQRHQVSMVRDKIYVYIYGHIYIYIYIECRATTSKVSS